MRLNETENGSDRLPGALIWLLLASLIVSIHAGAPGIPTAGAQAEVVLDVTKSSFFKVPVVVEEFTWQNLDPVVFQGRQWGEEVLIDDLLFSDSFVVLRCQAGSPLPAGLLVDVQGNPVDKRVQARIRIEVRRSGSKLKLKTKLLDESTGQEIFGKTYDAHWDAHQLAADRWGIHRLADEISYYLTGTRGCAATRIVYVNAQGSDRDLHLIDWDGLNSTSLTNLGAIILSPTWKPDGRTVAFTSFHEGQPKLYAYDLKKQKLTKIVSSTTPSAPKYSPNGKNIAYSTTKDGNAEIYIAKADGSKPKRLTFHNAIDTAPSWSPSGKQIVFTSDRWGNPQLFIINADGTDLTQLTFAGRWNDSPDWSPVKDRIVHVCRIESSFELAVIETNGDGWRLITNFQKEGGCENPRWAPDGRHVVFARLIDNQRSIWILDVDTCCLRRLTRSAGDSYNPAWSFTAKDRLNTQ